MRSNTQVIAALAVASTHASGPRPGSIDEIVEKLRTPSDDRVDQLRTKRHDGDAHEGGYHDEDDHHRQ